MNPEVTILVLCGVGAYLIGSIPFGLILTRLAGLGDIRSIGSGNIGATNVLRTGNKKLAAATLILDGAKGAVAVAIAWQFGALPATVAAGCSVIGHIYPIWLKFRGGKGVATVLGVWLALAWPIGVAACALWLATARLFRYSSLAALVAIGATPILAAVLAGSPQIVVAAVLASLVFWRHEANIRRLLAGTEPRIGARKT